MNNDDKCHLIEKSTNVINEIDHRMPVYWPCLTTLCQAIAPSITDTTLSNLINQVCVNENDLLSVKYNDYLSSGLIKCYKNLVISPGL